VPVYQTRRPDATPTPCLRLRPVCPHLTVYHNVIHEPRGVHMDMDPRSGGSSAVATARGRGRFSAERLTRPMRSIVDALAAPARAG